MDVIIFSYTGFETLKFHEDINKHNLRYPKFDLGDLRSGQYCDNPLNTGVEMHFIPFVGSCAEAMTSCPPPPVPPDPHDWPVSCRATHAPLCCARAAHAQLVSTLLTRRAWLARPRPLALGTASNGDQM